MFEWDELKAVANLRKHHVSFIEAVTVFSDPDGLDGADIAHSDEEERRLRIGKSAFGRILTIAYTFRRRHDDETKVRIISARRASRKERKTYERTSQKD
jgi:uncharacterized DUF497 family protein